MAGDWTAGEHGWQTRQATAWWVAAFSASTQIGRMVTYKNYRHLKYMNSIKTKCLKCMVVAILIKSNNFQPTYLNLSKIHRIPIVRHAHTYIMHITWIKRTLWMP